MNTLLQFYKYIKVDSMWIEDVSCGRAQALHVKDCGMNSSHTIAFTKKYVLGILLRIDLIQIIYINEENQIWRKF